MVRRFTGPVAVTVAAVMLAACSSAPQPAPTGKAPVAVNPQPGQTARGAGATGTAVAPATGAAAATVQSTASSPAESSANDRQFASFLSQYRRVTKNGTPYYCRSEAPLGSRLAQDHCYTEAELAQRFAIARDARDGLNAGTQCGAKSCSGQ